MFHQPSGRRQAVAAIALLVCAGTAAAHQAAAANLATPFAAHADTGLLADRAEADASHADATASVESADDAEARATIALFDRLDATGATGLSGRLLASVVEPAQLALAEQLPIAVDEPGVRTLRDPRDGREHSLITLVPFAAKAGRASLDGYRLGFWPGERARRASGAYALPDGFIRVTEENQDTRVSEHFRLRDFLTKDQPNVWPKYLVLDLSLVDKLELMLEELRAMGYDARHLHVMSGFRTPQYNQQGVGAGRAQNSRHQYGDAADVFVDNDRDGRLDDLNGDGRVTIADARIIAQAAERVEDKHPALVGGIGVYNATSAHPPFVHVDTRGTRARW